MTIGLLLRKEVRRYLMTEGFKFEEEKGVFDSLFIVYGTENRLRGLRTVMQDYQRRLSATVGD